MIAGDANGETLYSFDTAEDWFAPAEHWSAWQDTLDQHEAQRYVISQCLNDDASCPKQLRGLRIVLLKGAELNPEQRIRLVNRFVNRQRYRDDSVSSRSGAGNQFETLTSFLSKGGDCEDFAVAKYFILREFGVDAADMRIVIGKEPRRTEHHAMLAIRIEDSIWLLENDNTIRRNGGQDIDRFVYAINERGIWDHEKDN